ncbi:MAG: triose-phosphate isomerase family protein [Bacillota bacterium]
MKHIFLNLKRFDILRKFGGVNDVADVENWAKVIAGGIEEGVKDIEGINFGIFFQEGHLMNASKELSKVKCGCQGVFRRDTAKGVNFGAFTTFQTANSATQMGATYALIGHCEERNNLREIIERAGGTNIDVINEILNEEIKCAIEAGMKVLYCVGERTEEQENKAEVLALQVSMGLKDVDLSKVEIAYEPVWAIGPGKPVPTAEYIDEVAKLIKATADVPVVYGGGLKLENAEMMAKIESLDGGLIALTTFGADFGFSVENYLKIVKKYKESL